MMITEGVSSLQKVRGFFHLNSGWTFAIYTPKIKIEWKIDIELPPRPINKRDMSNAFQNQIPEISSCMSEYPYGKILWYSPQDTKNLIIQKGTS